MSLTWLVLSFVTVSGSSFAQTSSLPETADRQVVLLNPAFFTELPKNLVAELQRRGCRIPQVAHAGRQNVIKGEFAKPGQSDWAVLCSFGQFTSILVFWNASEINPARIAQRKEDLDRLHISDEYIRLISPVGKLIIMDHHKHSGGPKPPPLDHQGIDDASVGKASVIYYFFNGKWLQLMGAD